MGTSSGFRIMNSLVGIARYGSWYPPLALRCLCRCRGWAPLPVPNSSKRSKQPLCGDPAEFRAIKSRPGAGTWILTNPGRMLREFWPSQNGKILTWSLTGGQFKTQQKKEKKVPSRTPPPPPPPPNVRLHVKKGWVNGCKEAQRTPMTQPHILCSFQSPGRQNDLSVGALNSNTSHFGGALKPTFWSGFPLSHHEEGNVA